MKKIISTVLTIAILCMYLLPGSLVFAVTPPETTSDASTPDSLATIGTPYTDNFTKNLLSIHTYEPTLNYIIENDESIAGKSFKFAITGGSPAPFAGLHAFGTANKFVANGRYRLKFDYKYTSTNAPNNFYYGFKNDNIPDQQNTQIDFTGKVQNTVYEASHDFNLLNHTNYYMYMFALGSMISSSLIIDNIYIERLYVGDSFYPETTPDSTTIDDLSTVNTTFTENFTKGSLGSYYDYNAGHYSIINDERAIAGKSFMQDFTAASFGGVYVFNTKFKLVGGASYRITAKYKFLTDTAPTGFYFGFTRDAGANQKNINVDFSGKVKDTVYDFTADYTLDDYSDYYLQWFNLNAADGSKMVIDNLSITLLGTETTDTSVLSDMLKIGRPFTENFTKNVLNMWSYDFGHFSIIEGAEALFGKSVKQDFTAAGNGGIYGFATKYNLVAGGTYRLSVKYKVLTEIIPTGMYFGFTIDSDPNAQKNTPINFTNNVKDRVYLFTADYVLDNHSDYYLQWFNLSATDGSKIAIDSIKITLLDTPSHYTFDYTLSGSNYLSGMAKQINTSTFLTGMQLKAGVTVQLLTPGDVVLGASDYVATGTKIKVNNGTTITDYTAVVKGDSSGDGNIDLSDLAASKLHLLNSTLLTGPYLAAGDVTGNAGISISDLLFIKKAIM
jgi:hypothetical protein